jgi:hypothetical protein
MPDYIFSARFALGCAMWLDFIAAIGAAVAGHIFWFVFFMVQTWFFANSMLRTK